MLGSIGRFAGFDAATFKDERVIGQQRKRVGRAALAQRQMKGVDDGRWLSQRRCEPRCGRAACHGRVGHGGGTKAGKQQDSKSEA